MTADEKRDEVFAAERAAWEVVKWCLPGHPGHDGVAWTRWQECSSRANELLHPGNAMQSAPSPEVSSAEHELLALVFEVQTELSTVKSALDALDEGGALLRGATGALLKRSLQAIDRALVDAADSLAEPEARTRCDPLSDGGG